MPNVRVRGIDMYYETIGDGPTLVFAHGLLNSIELTRRFGERIDLFAAEGLRVVAYDARGHGRSGYTARKADYHWSALAEDLVAFMDAAGIERAAVYGGSMGAGTAILAALEHPGRIERLILRAPPPFGDDVKHAQSIFGPLAVMLRLFGPRLTARIVASLPQARGARTASDVFDLRGFIEAQRRESMPAAIEGVLFGERMPTHRFERIVQPALVITHPDDPIHPLRSGELLHERMPHARLVVAPEYGYWQANQQELARIVASFVRGDPPHRDAPPSALGAPPPPRDAAQI